MTYEHMTFFIVHLFMFMGANAKEIKLCTLDVLNIDRGIPFGHVLKASLILINMWPCTLKLDDEKSKHVGLVQK